MLTGYVCLYVFKNNMSPGELLTVEDVEDFVFVASMSDENLFCTKALGAVCTEKILGNILAILESYLFSVPSPRSSQGSCSLQAQGYFS